MKAGLKLWTPAEIEMARALHAHGMGYKRIAWIVGRPRGAVFNVVNYKRGFG